MTQWQQDPYQRRPVDIDAYAPPPQRGGWWLAVVGAVLVGVVLAALLLRPPLPGSAPGDRPADQPVATADPSASPLPGMPFTMPGSTTSHGRWELLERTWDQTGVTVRVRVTADGGRVSYGFVAFADSGTEVYEPLPDAPEPQIGSGTLRAGQHVEGNLRLPLPHGPSTLILTTAEGRQVSALKIPA